MSKLLVSMMNRETTEVIGTDMGEMLDVEIEEDGLVVGRYLRIKVRINIRKALRRGIILHVGGSGRE